MPQTETELWGWCTGKGPRPPGSSDEWPPVLSPIMASVPSLSGHVVRVPVILTAWRQWCTCVCAHQGGTLQGVMGPWERALGASRAGVGLRPVTQRVVVACPS